MAAECRLAERRIVEIKMGRSKFPGKPSKIGNRKRVNLSSCALPEENESSKAAENIYLGLSMFNETFGDNEMVQPGPFYGFCAEDIKDAMAQARLQQRESEMELMRQGIKVSVQNSFQSELFSIIGSFTLNGNHDKNKTRLCFDGGGSHVKEHTKIEEINDSKLTNTDKIINSLNRNNDNIVINDFKSELNSANTEKNQNKAIKTDNPERNTFKYHKAKNSFKSLQSRAAKRLLDKAKMSNLSEIKCNTSERKFVLPSYSMHSLRVIKPNKRFLEDNDNKKERFLRPQSKTQSLSSKILSVVKESKPLANDLHLKELKVELTDVNVEKKIKKQESSLEEKTNNRPIINDKLRINCSSGSSKTNANYTSSGKLILREPKLQLVRINLGLKEGPFSSSSRSSSLSPNGNLQGNHIQTSIMHKATTCGVCGSAKFYKYFELSKKFGIYCCEPCKKFISGIIKSLETETNKKLLCLKGKGLCSVPPLIKSQHSSVIRMDCQACWLKLCLKYFKMSHKLKSKLLQLLPTDMHLSVNLDSSISAKDDINTFGISNNIKNFGWVKKIDQKSAINKINRVTGLDLKEKKEKKSLTSLAAKRETNLRKLNIIKRLENKRRLLRHKGRIKVLTESGNRQRIDLKGPRVKNVCRSASVVLGQPIATFPLELSSKKQINDFPLETIKNCDKLEATNRSSIESQGITVVNKNSKDVSMTETKQSGFEKKSNHGNKHIMQTKRSSSPPQRFRMEGTRRKQGSKTENPISIDFWETYDPEEISETGFGLIGSENFSVRALCFLCGSSGQEKLIHCASCCEPYHEFCLDEEQVKRQDEVWKYDWVCPRCTICVTCGKASGHQLKCVKCDNSYHMECVDRVGGRLLHSPDRPWVCSMCLRCKSCNGVDVSIFVGNLPLCRSCFALQQKGNYCPLCQRCYEDNDYDSKMMECGQCKCWVHAKCEGLSDEKYQVLSFLPESVEYICRMCCVMPPAPWWIAIEAELKSGYLGVLKALSKNRKACTMLKWSPKKQCTCRQANITPRALDFEDVKSVRSFSDQCQNKVEELKKNEQEIEVEKYKKENIKTPLASESKNCFEAVNGVANGSLKLTLKIMKGTTVCETTEKNDLESEEKSKRMKDIMEMHNIKKCSVRIKKCSLPENSRLSISLPESFENNQLMTKNSDFSLSRSESNEKKSLFLPINPSNDSGIGSTDDELKTIALIDEGNCKIYDQHSSRIFDSKNTNEPPVSFLESKNDCICFLEVDSYNSRSKPFSPNLLSIKKKVITSEYSSLQQFHVDMQSMIATTQSTELMEMYYQTVKEIFPWFDPKFSRVYNNSQKISGNMSTESTPIKNSPIKTVSVENCKVPKEVLIGQPLEYYYSGYIEKDNRICLMCKEIGDGAPNKTGRLLYCGQNEWVHCNCALWSAEVFEEIDGSLQNVHSAISRGRSIRCSECNLKGASIGCCFKNCSETYHFTCARNVGCSFMDDKTVFCPSHVNEGKYKGIQKEKEFEIRRPVYVELDKKKMKTVDSNQVRFAVGSLQVENLGKFVMNVSDHPEAIIPDQFRCTRLFWSCYEPWKIVKYHFTARLQEDEEKEGVDFGINFTVDHSLASEILNVKLQQLKYFQEHNKLLEIDEPSLEDIVKEKRKLSDTKSEYDGKIKSDELKYIPAKRLKVDNKIMKKIVDVFDPREDESCLSDSQNTADLLPPELEEAIFKDLPNDILDGISMQDIFMDIKSDLYENGEKEVKDVDDSLETEEITNEQTKLKKTDNNGENNQNDIWTTSEDSKQNVYEWTDETCLKSNRDSRKNRSDIILPRRNVTLRSNQRSCNLNWNCKMDIHTAKWKRNSKCTSMNPLEPQERGNMLQELKFTDGLVMVSTEGLDRVIDLKDRLTIQHEEGKENKCLSWHMKLQPRLLQVDGGVDSSSSGSEAGESPQRIIEENLANARVIAMSQPSPFSSNISYVELNNQFPSSQTDYSYIPPSFNLPQIDGADDSGSDDSDSENSPQNKFLAVNYKVNQLAGNIDSGNETKTDYKDKLSIPVANNYVKDEPVKCKQCHCTYRTKMSYERHLENCSNDYILFSSDDEGSEEDNSFHHLKTEEAVMESHRSTKIEAGAPSVTNGSNQNSLKCISQKTEIETNHNERILMNNEIKRKRKKKSQTQRKPVGSTKKTPVISNSQNVQPILMQSNTISPALIVQDIPQASIVPGAFIDTSSTFQYVTSVGSQGAFTKPQLIANPNNTIPGSFHIQTHGSQLVSSLPVLPQNIQTNIPGIVIQHPQVTGTLISPQPTSVVMAGDQMVLGTTPLFDVIHDPQTGGMYLANQNQPIFYNTETIVSNTVMQTNQYVSNVMTASSFSQTSTHVVQTSKLEQIMNIPSNYILIGHNTASNKMLSSGDLICLPSIQPLIQNQTPVQTVINPIIQPSQTYNAEPKIIPVLVNPSIRPVQPMQSQRLCTPVVSNKTPTIKNINSSSEIRPYVPPICNKNFTQNKQCNNNFKSMPMMRPNVAKSPPKQFEKAVIVPKTQKNGSRALVDFINNFKTDSCDFYSSMNHSEASNKKEKVQLLGEKLSNANRKIMYSEENFVPDNTAVSRSPLTMNSLSLSSSPKSVHHGKGRETVRVKQDVPVLKKFPHLEASQSVQIMEIDIKEEPGFNDKRRNLTTRESAFENVKMEDKSTMEKEVYANKNMTEREEFNDVKKMTESEEFHDKKNITKREEFHDDEKNMTERDEFDGDDENMTEGEGFVDDDKNVAKKEEFDDDDENMTEKEEFDDEDDDDNDEDDDDDDDDDDDKIMAERESDGNNKNMTEKEEFDNSEEKNEQVNEKREEYPSKEENSMVNVLPLQETSPSANNTHNVLPKISNMKIEGLKETNKLFSSNQNYVAAKLVTIHPRLIQFPTSEHEVESENKKKFSTNGKSEDKGPKLIFDVTSDDGFTSSSTSMSELWAKICDSVQEMRAVFKIPPLPISRKGHEILGMQNHGLQHCLEQLRGVEHCVKYKCKYFVKERTQKTADDGLVLKENLSGCARTESFCVRKDYDMFAWLASRHRRLPKLNETTDEIFSSARRANSLPMAMRYRHLKETAKTYVGVYRSKIHGKGLFCLREIEAGEMVIEYAGEVIRSNITDKREKYYTNKGIGCYMFRIDDHFVVDATMKGNAARFINHSCEPNCYSRVVDILGKKHIVIFALRRIRIMEELTYDYKFPFEDEKISCHCLSKKCRKYLN